MLLMTNCWNAAMPYQGFLAMIAATALKKLKV
jgi:hypothetical protein